MPSGVDVELARRVFLTDGQRASAGGAVRAEVLASWERSRQGDVDPNRLAVAFVGNTDDGPVMNAGADEVFDEFLTSNRGALCSLVALSSSAVVRARSDGDPTLARMLDALLLVPGYSYGERVVGTTAASIALHEGTDFALSGPEHYSYELMCLSEAAALMSDGVVVVVCHRSQETGLQISIARMLAREIQERMEGQPYRRSRAVHERFAQADRDGDWVLATDGHYVLTNASARHLDTADVRILNDLLLSNLVLRDFGCRHVDLPSGGCAEVTTSAVHLSRDLVGCVLAGAPVGARRAVDPPEAVRRQGSHVAPLTRRDYAEDLRGSEKARKEHAAARIRANRDLMTPILRARHEVVASITQGRNHLLIGEPGVGRRTLATTQFRRAFPQGRLVSVDCASCSAATGASPSDASVTPFAVVEGRPHLLLLREMNALTPVGARRLDEVLRPLVALPTPPLVMGCIDTPAIDATRPYGLLLRHFHEVTRVPPLRYRIDEIGEIALSILQRRAMSRSVRLSLQVIRVLESYPWPGNISELEDVLKYVVARKPVGEIQPPDLPRLCFQGRGQKMSMLEAAQCDAIIQALYESRGNRYKAAAMLGIARSSLYRKIDAFGISYIA